MSPVWGVKSFFVVLLGWICLAPGMGGAQIYNPYYSPNPCTSTYPNGYGYGYGGYGYGGVQYYNYNAPYSHIYYSPTYSVQPRGSYSVPYYYGGYSYGPSHGPKPSKPSGGFHGYVPPSSQRGEVPAGTVGWIPAPVSERSRKVQNGE